MMKSTSSPRAEQTTRLFSSSPRWRGRAPSGERQRALLHRAYDVSYRIVGVAIGLYLVTHFWLMDPSRFPGLPPQHARNLAINLYVMLPFLPAAVIGWIEPDLPEES